MSVLKPYFIIVFGYLKKNRCNASWEHFWQEITLKYIEHKFIPCLLAFKFTVPLVDSWEKKRINLSDVLIKTTFLIQLFFKADKCCSEVNNSLI